MSEAAMNADRPWILHIRSPRASSAQASPASSEELITAALAAAESCPDVYRGLARILTAEPKAYRAVVVCVDDLGAAEFEFFTLVSGQRRSLAVYVYGRDRSQSRVTRAIELGATGELTQSVLSGVVAAGNDRRLPSEPVARAESPPPSPLTTTSPGPVEKGVEAAAEPSALSEAGSEETPTVFVVPRVPVRQEPQPQPAPATDEPPDEDREEEPPPLEEDSPAPTRVPWLRYGNRPARTGPARRGPVRPERPAAGPAGPPREPEKPAAPQAAPYEPLLSEEELEALMNDDVPEVGLSEREMLIRDDDDGSGRGLP